MPPQDLQVFLFTSNQMELPEPSLLKRITPILSTQLWTTTKKAFTPLTKQLQGHEGEHEKAKHEEQKDIGDLW